MVLVCAVAAVVGSAVGVGAFGGTPIAEAGGGALSADATLLAPAGTAFSIWTPIYLGLVAYAVWQLAPSRRDDPRQARVGWLVAASMLLNVGWILTVQAGAVQASVAVILALLAVLVTAYRLLLLGRPTSRLEAVLLDGTTGLYLGWVSVATVANTAAAVVDAGVSDFGVHATAWAVAALVLVAVLGVTVAFVGRGRLAYGAALAWGLAWIAGGRATGAPDSSTVAVVAALASLVVVVTTLLARRSAA